MARILLVDDSRFMRGILKNILKEEHEVVGEAESGVEALQAYERWSPDLVLMDIVMPDVDGITATREIITRHPEARIVMCTSMGQESKVKKAIEAGAKGYIVKPFQSSEVLQEVEAVLRC